MPIERIDYADIAPFRTRAAADRVALGPTKNTEWFADRDAAGRIISIGGLIWLSGHGARLKGLWVEPEARGKSAGSGMVLHLLAHAEARCAAFLEAITVSPALYARLGFRQAGISGNGVVIMRRVL